jgi:hypothetical protein
LKLGVLNFSGLKNKIKKTQTLVIKESFCLHNSGKIIKKFSQI